MKMPKGVTLKRKGNFEDVKTYGEHVYRAYSESYFKDEVEKETENTE
jgi:hypothetical protein